MRGSSTNRSSGVRPSTSHIMQVIHRFSKTHSNDNTSTNTKSPRQNNVRFTNENFSNALGSTLVTEVPNQAAKNQHQHRISAFTSSTPTQSGNSERRSFVNTPLNNNKSQPSLGLSRASMTSPKKRQSQGVGGLAMTPAEGQIRETRKEKKFGLQDYLNLEENYTDLQKAVRLYYNSINNKLKSIGSEDLTEYLNSIWDFDPLKKEAKDLMPIVEELFSTMIQFYNAQEEELYRVRKLYENQGDAEISTQSKDYLFLLQTQEAEARALTRENQQLKLSVQSYAEKLKNSEIQGNLLASYAQKEMENIKQEFQFAISELKQREDDVEVLKKEMQSKNEQLEQLEERLLSVFILEHKIRALGSKSTKDIEKTVFEFTEKIKEVDKSSREALRKERQDNEHITLDFRNRINVLTQENRKLRFENKTRIQQLNDIIFEKDQYLQKKVVKLQDVQEKLALRNKEVYQITSQKDRYGTGTYASNSSTNAGAGQFTFQTNFTTANSVMK